MTGYLPTSDNRNSNAFFLSPALNQKEAIIMQTWPVDENYISVLGMKVEQGRDFSCTFLTDSNGIVINSAAARMLGSGNPIGRRLYQLDDVATKKVNEWHVVGVVKDFNFSSLRQVVTPMSLYLEEDK